MISRVVNYSGRSFFIQLVFLIGFVLLLSRQIYIQVLQDVLIKKQLYKTETIQRITQT